jgi:N-acetylglucosaminyl-diphospho-decaprenol L-rhamnosyltransferase
MIYWITVNYYSTHLIERLIHSISSQYQMSWKLIIVNNSPGDLSIHQFKDNHILILNSPKNLGFGAGCNLGLNWVYQQDKKAIIWLINPDAYLTENAALNAIECFQQNPTLSILGTLVQEPDNRVGIGGGTFNPQTGEILPQAYHNALQKKSLISIDWVSGCSLLINLIQFPACPQFDSDYFLYYEDFDFCMRYHQQGHLLAIASNITVIHHPSSITNKSPHLKLEHSIYSYLLSLEKYASSSAFWYRLIRISLVSFISLFISPSIGLSKFKGLIRYCRWIFRSANLE